MTNYRYGYVRVSTLEQDPAGQLDAMTAAGVERDRVFVKYASGALDSRPELAKVLAVLRPGDTPSWCGGSIGSAGRRRTSFRR